MVNCCRERLRVAADYCDNQRYLGCAWGLGGAGRDGVVMNRDPLTLADEAEERSAADALRAATSANDLADAWFVNVSRYFEEGTDANERLYRIYCEQLGRFVPGAWAG